MVLFEHSEYALYLAKRELSKAAKREGVEIIAVLGSVCDADMVRHVMQVHSTDVVFHAAAYKHVPLVETNVVMGLKNNVLGTHVLAREAVKAGVERFVQTKSKDAFFNGQVRQCFRIVRIGYPVISQSNIKRGADNTYA